MAKCTTLSDGVIKLNYQRKLREVNKANEEAGLAPVSFLSYKDSIELLKSLPVVATFWSTQAAKTALESNFGKRQGAQYFKALNITAGNTMATGSKISLETLQGSVLADENTSAFSVKDSTETAEKENTLEWETWRSTYFGPAAALEIRTVKAFTVENVITAGLTGFSDVLPKADPDNPLRGVNREIKDSRSRLLQELLSKSPSSFTVEQTDAINGLTSKDDTRARASFAYMAEHENEINTILKETFFKINGEEWTHGLLVSAGVVYNRLSPELKNAVDNYMTLVRYLSFDQMMKRKGGEVINITGEAFYDADAVSYTYPTEGRVNLMVWNKDEVTDHAKTQSPAVKLMLNNTQMLSHITKLPIKGVYTTDVNAANAWKEARKYYDATAGINGFINTINKALKDPNISTEHKNILYTLLETYFNPENPNSLLSKSSVVSAELLNVLFSNFRSMVEMNFTEVHQVDENSFKLKNINEQAKGARGIFVKSMLNDSLAYLINTHEGEIDQLFSELSQKEISGWDANKVLDKINEILGDSFGLNIEGITGLSIRSVLMDSYSIDSLKDLLINVNNLRNGLVEQIIELQDTKVKQKEIEDLGNNITKVSIDKSNGSLTAIIDILANAIGVVNGDTRKMTVKNAHGTTNAVFGNSNLISQIRSTLGYIKKQSQSLGNMTKLFEKNPLIAGNYFKNIFFRGDIVDSSGESTVNAKASFSESSIYNLNYFYAEAIANDGDPSFDFTNFSDKTLNGAIQLDRGLFLRHKGTPQQILDAKMAAFREMQLDYLEKTAMRMINTYESVFQAMYSRGLIDVIPSFKSDNLPETMINLNDALDAIFTVDGKPRKFAYGDKILTSDEVLNLAAVDANVTVINYLDYNDNVIRIKDTLIKELIILSDPAKTKQFMAENFKDFKNSFKLSGVELNNIPDKENITKAYHKIFGQEMKINDPKHQDEFLASYFFDWLLASNSIMNATAGHSINQKSKPFIKTVTSEELRDQLKGTTLDSNFIDGHVKALSALWQAQTKRNVIFTASMIPYIINTWQGMKNGANVSFVRDEESELKPIGFAKQGVTDWDGASIGMMHHMVRIYKSSGGAYSSDGGVDQKSFITFMDPLLGSSTMIKHALFAMTPGVVKASAGNDLDIRELYRNLYAKQDLRGINITKLAKGAEGILSPSNFYYFEDVTKDKPIGAIKQVLNIKHSDNLSEDVYEITEKDLLTDKITTRREAIANMWDFLNAFKAFNTLIPSQKRTTYNISDAETSSTRYFTPSFGAFELLMDIEDSCVDSGAYNNALDPGVLMNEISLESIDVTFRPEPDYEDRLRRGWEAYKLEVNEDGDNDDAIILETLEAIASGRYSVSRPEAKEFAQMVLSQKDNLTIVPYQPLKGKMTDMITTYGGAKVGQTNINSLQTLLGLEQDPEKQLPGINTLYHKLINYQNAGLQVDTSHSYDHAELSMPKQMLAALNFGMLEGDRAKELNLIMSSLILENINEDITLREYLNDTKNIVATITKALANPKLLPEIQKVFKGALNKEDVINLTEKINSQQGISPTGMISSLELFGILNSLKLSGSDLTSNNLMNAADGVLSASRSSEEFSKQVAAKFSNLLADPTLVEHFNLSDILINAIGDFIPIDHSAVLAQAVSSVAASFSNKAARLKFDGLLAVIQPASRMIQVVDIDSNSPFNVIPYRSGNQIKYRTLLEGEKVQLLGEQLKLWQEYHNIPDEALKRRELKGPELLGTLEVTDADGNVTEELFIGSLLDVDSSATSQVFSQFNTSQATEALDEMIKSYTKKGSFIPPSDSNALGVLQYLSNEIGHTGDLTTPQGIQNFIESIQAYYLDFTPTKGLTHEASVAKWDKANKDSLKVRTQRLLGQMTLRIIQEDVTTAHETGVPKVSAFIDPTFWAGKRIKNLHVDAGEIVAPALYQDKFLLREGDDFNSVNAIFFYERLKELNTVKLPADKKPSFTMLSEKGAPVLIYQNEKDFKAATSGKTKIEVKDGNVLGSSGEILFELPAGISGEIFRDLDNNIIMMVKPETANPYDEIANLKGALNKATGAGYRLSKFREGKDFEKHLRAEAAKMWESFKLMNEVTGARIPGQHYQSFQYLKVVGWINDKQSAVWVPRATTLFAGLKYQAQ